MTSMTTQTTAGRYSGRVPSKVGRNLDERVKQVTRSSVDHAVNEVVRRISSGLKL